VFAKGKYSKAIDGRSVANNSRNYINIVNGKHPLLGKVAIPLNLVIGDDYRALVITGPNTGGKTVALKTVGIFTLMVQSGLHIPVDKGSELSIFVDVLVDIGDGQSIEQNLSTFSSHINNIISILGCADKNTLVIMDEIGAGTDPGEGMGIAVAVLQEVYSKGAIILATTHYSEIKDFASTHRGFINGCMEFDINTLKPLYKLNVGKPGASNAFLIALKLGMDKKIIEKAHQITYKENKQYCDYDFMDTNIGVNLAEASLEHEKQLEKFETVLKENKISKKHEDDIKFNLGDNVYISFMNRSGIIYELENSKGEYGVLVMKKKLKINKKRLSLYIESKDLYPEEYDFSIVFESVENRKNQRIMSKRHVEGLEIKSSDEI
jgi:dsDNA-specific endonuclease/ATPase MutS2